MNNNVDENQAALNAFVRKIKDELNGQLPCRVTEVNADGSVDVLVIRNDEEKDVVFPNVPIRHFETTRAFIYLGVVAGDKGVIRFFDRSIEDYKTNGSTSYNGDERQHSLSDGLFEYGFYPSSEAYAFPKNKTIAVGNKNGSFLLTIGDNGQLICSAANYEFTGSVKFNDDVEFVKNVAIKGDTEASGKIHAVKEIASDIEVKAAEKSLTLHTHKSSAPGISTSPPE